AKTLEQPGRAIDGKSFRRRRSPRGATKRTGRRAKLRPAVMTDKPLEEGFSGLRIGFSTANGPASSRHMANFSQHYVEKQLAAAEVRRQATPTLHKLWRGASQSHIFRSPEGRFRAGVPRFQPRRTR